MLAMQLCCSDNLSYGERKNQALLAFVFKQQEEAMRSEASQLGHLEGFWSLWDRLTWARLSQARIRIIIDTCIVMEVEVVEPSRSWCYWFLKSELALAMEWLAEKNKNLKTRN